MRRLVMGALVAAAAFTGCTCSSPAPKAEPAVEAPAAPERPKGPVRLANPEALPQRFSELQKNSAPTLVQVDPETARWARERDAIAHALLQRGEVAQARTMFEMIIARTPAGSPQHEAAKRALEQAPH